MDNREKKGKSATWIKYQHLIITQYLRNIFTH